MAICATATTAISTRATALHWLLHNAHGAATLNRLNLPADQVADLLVRAAAMHPTEKRKDPNMQNMDKTLREVGEHGFYEMVRKYAKTVHPTLTKEQAFTKVFTEDSDTGRAIRRAHQIAKHGVADGRTMTRKKTRGRQRARRVERTRRRRAQAQSEFE